MIRIYEKKPNGKDSVKGVIDWLNRIDRKAENARPLWESLTPELKQSVKYEFSEDNPNKWQPITQKWINRKMKEGKPVTIGIYTGALKAAASDNANITYLPDRMSWAVNSSVEYAGYFNKKRPIFRYTRKYISRVADRALNKFLKMITEVDK